VNVRRRIASVPVPGGETCVIAMAPRAEASDNRWLPASAAKMNESGMGGWEAPLHCGAAAPLQEVEPHPGLSRGL
jgi:hypothetical protein